MVRCTSAFVRRMVCVLLVAGLLFVSSPALAQTGGTATVRGTVTDASGAVLPGVTVTITNSGTRDTRTAITDDRGGYLFSALFSGTYELRVELEGFRAFERTSIALSPNDTRGLDVTLDVGSLTEVISVTSAIEIVQTETGAREGLIKAEQIENLSLVGRSSLELLRILPGVVSPNLTAFESVSFGGGANSTQGYTVNGIRSSGNTVSLDGSALIDIGSNNGLMVTLNNDMVQEVKVQSSNFAAEYGSGGMNVSAVTKAGASEFHGTLYDYIRHHRFQANDRSNSIAGVDKPESQFHFPGGNIGGPVALPGLDFNRNRDKLFFFLGLEAQRQEVDSGTTFQVVPTELQRQGIFTELLTENGQNLDQPVGAVLIPPGFPGAGTPAPNADLSPYAHPVGEALVHLFPESNYNEPDNRYNYAFNELQPTNRTDLKMRFDYNVSNNTKAYVRMAFESEEVESARGVWWGASEVALPSPNRGTNKGRSYAANVVTVLSPTMTNEALVSFSRLKLDNTFTDPSRMSASQLPGWTPSFPGASPYLPGLESNGGFSTMRAAANDMFAHNDELQFSNKLTKIAGAHALKFGVTAHRLQKQQNFQNDEEGFLQFRQPNDVAGSSGNQVGDLLVGRVGQFNQGTRPPNGEYRMWDIDVFAQDSWKLAPNFTFEYGVRAGYWTNNRELNGLGGWFDPSLYDPSAGQFLDPGTFRELNGIRYVRTGDAPAGILETRSPFAMPRLGFAWNIDGRSDNVLRGGYGLFYNRSMGNVEYDNTLRLPPDLYSLNVDVNSGSEYGDNLGLTYDTLQEATLQNRLGTVGFNTLMSDSFSFPKTHSYSLSFARRLPFDQVAEVAYVGTRQVDLVSRVNLNAVPQEALLQGQIGNADLSNPVHRVGLDGTAVNQFRPFPTHPNIIGYEYEGESTYHSMQVTLSRQTSRNLQYFVAYTLSRAEGTLGDEYRERDPFDPSRTYGLLNTDRTHSLSVSWNAFLPDVASESGNPIVKGVLNGWQLSGISSVSSGIPIWLAFSGPAGSAAVSQSYYGTPSIVTLTTPGGQGNGLAPVYTCNPWLGGTKVGEKLLDVNCIDVPAVGEQGHVVPPNDIRTPTIHNHDLTIFKNFRINGNQRIQIRAGFFNLFNQAFPTTATDRGDIDLTLDTVCNRTVDNVPNGIGGTSSAVCDPTAGFSFTENTIANFGKINLLRGRRIIEFAIKYYF
ncbi:MAG: TonB-dependent receptor plug domain-containing protein [Luteitalea sp.]|nr:TonB-dependent receptor plug domain-containing protein [Luteitalea sp.]